MPTIGDSCLMPTVVNQIILDPRTTFMSGGVNTPFFESLTTTNACTSTSITGGNCIGIGGSGGTNVFFNVTSDSTTSIIGATYFTGEIIVDEEWIVNNQEYYQLALARGVRFRIQTEEEKRLARERAIQEAAEYEKRKQIKEAAEAKSKAFLIKYLTPSQFKSFKDNNWFLVIGGKTDTRYRIKTDYGVAGNILVLNNDDRAIAKLCCHMSHNYPKYDHFLGQKLSLEYDEENFLRIANRTALAA